MESHLLSKSIPLITEIFPIEKEEETPVVLAIQDMATYLEK